MSKVALCISGQPRFVEKGYECIKKHILDVHKDAGHSVDIFIHTWFDKDKKDNFNTEWSRDVNREDLDKIILKLYKPKDYIIEPQIEYLSYFPYSAYTKDTLRMPINIAFSMFYSLKTANDLKRYRELKKGKYDYVIRTRFDCGILSDLDVTRHSRDRIYFPDVISHNGADDVICDYLTFGGTEMIDWLSETYLFIDQYYKENCKICGENLITYHLKKRKIFIHGLPISMFLIRDKDFIDTSHYGRMW